MAITDTETKILVVDDEQEGRRLIKSILKQANYNVLEAANGVEALEIMRNEHLDLVVLDVNMPKMDGYRVCQEVRADKFLRRLPIILLTVMDETLDKVRGHRLGIDDYMTKPVDPEEFLTRVASVLDRRRLYEEISMTDSLTGLYNINFYKNQIDVFFNMARRSGIVFSIAVIDINMFKLINDTYGHVAGDYVLTRLAEILKKTLRKSDIITRYGGDEFVVIFPDLNSSQMEIAVDKIKKAVASADFTDERSGKKIPVSVSVGSATWRRDIKDPTELFDIADNKMYRDKKASEKKSG